jgi:hypothetical protein
LTNSEGVCREIRHAKAIVSVDRIAIENIAYDASSIFVPQRMKSPMIGIADMH